MLLSLAPFLSRPLPQRGKLHRCKLRMGGCCKTLDLVGEGGDELKISGTDRVSGPNCRRTLSHSRRRSSADS